MILLANFRTFVGMCLYVRIPLYRSQGKQSVRGMIRHASWTTMKKVGTCTSVYILSIIVRSKGKTGPFFVGRTSARREAGRNAFLCGAIKARQRAPPPFFSQAMHSGVRGVFTCRYETTLYYDGEIGRVVVSALLYGVPHVSSPVRRKRYRGREKTPKTRRRRRQRRLCSWSLLVFVWRGGGGIVFIKQKSQGFNRLPKTDDWVVRARSVFP